MVATVMVAMRARSRCRPCQSIVSLRNHNFRNKSSPLAILCCPDSKLATFVNIPSNLVHRQWLDFAADFSKYASNFNKHILLPAAVYRCTDCFKTFTSENSLRVHVRRHMNKKIGRYACDQCGQTFSQRSGQVSHTRVHTKEKPFACDVCQRQFSDFSTFTKHKRVHTGEKPYVCTICFKSFTQVIRTRFRLI